MIGKTVLLSWKYLMVLGKIRSKLEKERRKDVGIYRVISTLTIVYNLHRWKMKEL